MITCLQLKFLTIQKLRFTEACSFYFNDLYFPSLFLSWHYIKWGNTGSLSGSYSSYSAHNYEAREKNEAQWSPCSAEPGPWSLNPPVWPWVPGWWPPWVFLPFLSLPWLFLTHTYLFLLLEFAANGMLFTLVCMAVILSIHTPGELRTSWRLPEAIPPKLRSPACSAL